MLLELLHLLEVCKNELFKKVQQQNMYMYGTNCMVYLFATEAINKKKIL
jgi:hypothetical protein